MCGGGEIRTLGTREDSTVFKTVLLNRSSTPPYFPSLFKTPFRQRRTSPWLATAQPSLQNLHELKQNKTSKLRFTS
jgi:hypothetical protein